MKDLDDAKKILGTVIRRNIFESRLTITQETYMEKVITKFGMKHAKSINVPLAAHMNLSIAQSPKTEEEIKEMDNVPYTNAIGLFTFSMIITRPDLAYDVSFLNRFMLDPGKLH